MRDLFLPVAAVEMLSPAEHPHLPGHLHRLHDRICFGTRPCRQAAERMDVLVFEGFRDADRLFADPGVADVADPRTLPLETRLIVHLRPHQNPDDVEYVPSRPVSYL